VKKHLVGPISSGIAGYPALGAKIILRIHQKNCRVAKRKIDAKARKKAKTKHLLWDTFMQSIFINKVVTVGWVNSRGEKS